MWGIYYYKEIQDPKAIRNWFLSASVSVMGIVWLGRERIAAKAATDENEQRKLQHLLFPDAFFSY